MGAIVGSKKVLPLKVSKWVIFVALKRGLLIFWRWMELMWVNDLNSANNWIRTFKLIWGIVWDLASQIQKEFLKNVNCKSYNIDTTTLVSMGNLPGYWRPGMRSLATFLKINLSSACSKNTISYTKEVSASNSNIFIIIMVVVVVLPYLLLRAKTSMRFRFWASAELCVFRT